MVEGKYYYVWDDNYPGFMIGKCLGRFYGTGSSKAHFINAFNNNNSLHMSSDWCYQAAKRYYREATTDEIEWLQLCIKEGKVIKRRITNYELW